MRKIALFCVFCLAISLSLTAQDIKAGPLEGAWIWDGRGEDVFSELIFFGNVMLIKDSYYMEYVGGVFTIRDRSINMFDDFIDWQYNLSGTRLTIITEDNDHFSFIKAVDQKSPIEGIWKLTGGTNIDPDHDILHVLFTRDIMATMEDDNDEYMGLNIIYRDNHIYPDYGFSEEGLSVEELEEYLDEMYDFLVYRMSGTNLVLYEQDEELIFTKVY